MIIVGGVAFLLFSASLMCRNIDRQDRTVLSSYDSSVFTDISSVRFEKDKDFIKEFEKIVTSSSSRGLPVEIFKNDIPPNANIASHLEQQFSVFYEEGNSGELEALRSVRPQPGSDWEISSEALQTVNDVINRTDERRLFIRKLLIAKKTCFATELVYNKKTKESIPNWKAASYLDDYLLLEEFAVAKSLHEGNVHQAIDAAAYMFRLAQLASEVEMPSARAKVAQMRRKTIRITQAIALDPLCQEKDIVRLYDIMKEQLDHWVPDERAWIGARAFGMLIYEAVRERGMIPILGNQVIAEATRNGVMELYEKNILRSLTSDYTFYLQSMSTMIDSSRDVYSSRQKDFAAIGARLRERQRPESGPFPIIADFLLRNIREIMEACAVERAECESAFIAVATSANRPVGLLHHGNSLNGKPFQISTLESPPRVSVTFEGAEQPFIAPIFGKN